MKQAITETITQSVAEPEVNGKVEKKAGKRVGYNYIILKSFKESQKNDVVKCLYIKSLTDFGFCVIKEGSYGDTRDKNGRDIIDRLRWQKELHEQLQNKMPMPRLLGHFEERGNYYLVIGHIRGKSLQKAIAANRKKLRQSIINGGKPGIKFLNYLIQIAKILETLHANHLVHRDATPNNFMITTGGKVALIDMEMCYSIRDKFPTPAFALGTYGYMSKQQEAISVPTPAEDIFAFGAIMLQMWSIISPGKLTNDPIAELTNKIAFFIPDKQIADLVTQCLLPDDHLRPTATLIGQVLNQYKADLKKKVPRDTCQAMSFTREQILATVQEGINTLATPLLADERKGWFSNDMRPAPAEDKHKLRKIWYASYSHGVSGVIYMLAQAKRVGLDVSVNLPVIKKALDLIKQKYIDQIEQKKGGYNFGSDGIAAALTCAIREGLIEPTSAYLDWINVLLQKSNEGLNVSEGIAGQGIANLVSRYFVSSDNLLPRLENYAGRLITKQEPNGCWTSGYYRQKITKRKIKKATKGYMEGMCGIICFLLENGYLNKHTACINAAEKGLKWLIKNSRWKKGVVEWRTSKDKEMTYDITNGTAGIALCFIKAYQHTRKEIYKKYGAGTLNNIDKNITDGNISQRYGLAGLGEVYLEAYKVFKEEVWFDRATWIAQVIMQLKKQHPEHGVYWMAEQERDPVANFNIGNSGILHFLLRYCFGNQIGFPLMPEQ